jgi:hypothetical protein
MHGKLSWEYDNKKDEYVRIKKEAIKEYLKVLSPILLQKLGTKRKIYQHDQ